MDGGPFFHTREQRQIGMNAEGDNDPDDDDS